jgi:hypothetical protein
MTTTADSCNQCLLKQMALDAAEEDIRKLRTTVESMAASIRTLSFSNQVLTDTISKLVSGDRDPSISRADSLPSVGRTVVSETIAMTSSLDSTSESGRNKRMESTSKDQRTPSPKKKRPKQTNLQPDSSASASREDPKRTASKNSRKEPKRTASKDSRKRPASKDSKKDAKDAKTPGLRLQQCIACGATDANRNIARHFARKHDKDYKGTRALEVTEPLKVIPESSRPRLEDARRWKAVDWYFTGLECPDSEESDTSEPETDAPDEDSDPPNEDTDSGSESDGDEPLQTRRRQDATLC